MLNILYVVLLTSAAVFASQRISFDNAVMIFARMNYIATHNAAPLNSLEQQWNATYSVDQPATQRALKAHVKLRANRPHVVQLPRLRKKNPSVNP
ncbi:uncharacterized protein N7473_006623 [Penicillium subrubescens]|uniref:Uncharacterized protein n=1 Tax=Penicillium subrubescens TaxID=1316194 RepID=A0A1Q5SW86_9EURO|nr:uncharacterized protein N7473_006623 [Penicillium subrubescens]KAJ5890395.1 hypothetical protein N7473_006623 [Penicillium subrubescens]OKO92281.1 hypothetical protein PENSUB_12843 [Penicillium subrubescens]